MKINFRRNCELIIPIDNLSTFIFNPALDVESQTACLESRKSKLQTPLRVNLPRDSKGNAIPLTQFDRLVFIAAVSEIESGYPFTTYSRIFHLLGGGRNLSAAPNIKVAIAESFGKLRRAEFWVDLTPLIKKNKTYADFWGLRREPASVIITGALLPTTAAAVTINGQITEGAVKFLGTPEILEIAKMKKQLIHCDAKFLAAPLRCTLKTITLNGYLLERVLRIKGSNDAKRQKRVRKLQTSILFDTIFEQCGIDNDARAAAKCRNLIERILENFVTENLIVSFSFTQKESKFYSIEVEI